MVGFEEGASNRVVEASICCGSIYHKRVSVASLGDFLRTALLPGSQSVVPWHPYQEMLNKLAAAKVKTCRPEKRERWLFRRMAGLLPQAQKDDWVRQRKKEEKGDMVDKNENNVGAGFWNKR
ncbi:MAG: hypothetical protein AB1330_02760 [Bacillota bacterium]